MMYRDEDVQFESPCRREDGDRVGEIGDHVEVADLHHQRHVERVDEPQN